MIENQGPKNLFVLVADRDMLQTMYGLLNRSPSLGIRPVKYAIARLPPRGDLSRQIPQIRVLRRCPTRRPNELRA